MLCSLALFLTAYLIAPVDQPEFVWYCTPNKWQPNYSSLYVNSDRFVISYNTLIGVDIILRVHYCSICSDINSTIDVFPCSMHLFIFLVYPGLQILWQFSQPILVITLI